MQTKFANKRLAVSIAAIVMTLTGCGAMSPSSTPPPVVVGCPAPPPIPSSLRQAGERLKTQEDYSLRAQRNIRKWRAQLNETPSTLAPE
ncbi:spanin, outer lipoprotein subunit [Variovorax phage VarioGold]|nr:spanin, outer lipoprotein subunit [Variovorax phage VarioGold]